MAVVVNTTLKADTKDAVKQVEILKKEVEKVGKAAKKSGEDISAAMQIGNEATRALDKVSGGLASKLVKVAKAAKLSGKAMKTALISSGIGAAVVALGLIVEYWDDISEALGFVNKDLERQVELNAENLKLTTEQLSEIDLRIKLEKKQGGNADKLIKKRKELIKLQKAQILLSIADLKTQELDLTNEAKKVGFWERFSNDFMKRTAGMNKVTRDMMGKITDEEDKLINGKKTEIRDLEMLLLNIQIAETPDEVKSDAGETDAEKLAEQQRLKAIDDKASSIVEITKLEDDFLQSQLEKQTQEENAVYDKYFAQIQAAEDYGLDTTVLEEARQKELQVISDAYAEEAKDKEKKRLEDIQKIVNDATELSDLEKLENERLAAQEELKLLDATWIEKARINAFYMQQIADKEKEISDEKLDNDTKIADAKTDLQNKLVGNVQNAVGAIGNIFEKGTAASKGAALAEIAIGTGIGFINALDIAQKSAKGTGPAAAFAFPIFYASQIAAVLGAVSQAKNILSTVKGGGGSGSTPTAPSGGGSAPQPPAFNIVGASGETQLADAIGGQTQRPARAYVVSNDVTTAQEMDRNIIEGASIG